MCFLRNDRIITIDNYLNRTSYPINLLLYSFIFRTFNTCYISINIYDSVQSHTVVCQMHQRKTGISYIRLYPRCYVHDGYLFRVLANAVSRALLKWLLRNLHGDNGIRRRALKRDCAINDNNAVLDMMKKKGKSSMPLLESEDVRMR